MRDPFVLMVTTDGVHLVFHQGNQGTDDQCHTVHHQCWQLIAHGFPTPGRHDHEGVSAGKDALDGFFLLTLEFIESKKCLQRFVGRQLHQAHGKVLALLNKYKHPLVSTDIVAKDYDNIMGTRELTSGKRTLALAAQALERASQNLGNPFVQAVQSLSECSGKVVVSGEIWHGKTSEMFHDKKGVFAGIPSPFKATRYHSLVGKKDTLPTDLEITCETKNGLIQGVRHKTMPIFGVQFHPESCISEHGKKLFKNFLEVSKPTPAGADATAAQ